MADKVKDLLLADALLLQQLLDVKSQYLTFAARTLSTELKQRFGTKRKTFTRKNNRGFAEIYTSAMVTSWLYGAHHVQKLIDVEDAIELAGDVYNVPFDEAHDYLKAQITLDKAEFNKLEANLKFRAFTIARVGSEEVIDKVKALYLSHLKQGNSKNETLQQLDNLLDATGVSERNPQWLHTHFHNNMLAAYNAGRWAQVASNDAIVYLLYNAIKDGHTTDLCKKLHGIIKPKHDPFWKKLHPTNHHFCRSITTPLTQAQLERRNLKVSTLTDKDILQDSKAAAEHQFKSHPGASIKNLPKSLADRAKKYELTKDIVKYTATSNRKFFKKRIKEMTGTTLPKSAIAAAHQRKNFAPELADKATSAIESPDQILLSMSTESDLSMSATMLAVRWLDNEKGVAMVVEFGAFEGKAKTYYTMSKVEFDSLVENAHLLQAWQ